MNATSGIVPNTDNLKILIVSTPKTGNTWIKYLLANLYDLPIGELNSIEFNVAEAEALGPRWVAHQHYAARPDLIDWAERNGVVLVTTLRHPCDVLVSLFHYVRAFGAEVVFSERDRAPIMALDEGTIGEHTAAYVRDGFSTALDISLSWLRSGKSCVVRYEDLKHDPVAALEVLTASIQEVRLERIRDVAGAWTFEQMRHMPGMDPRFFRKGQVGGWRSELPPMIVDLLRQGPYPAQFAALGYSLDQDYSLIPLSRVPLVLERLRTVTMVNPHLPIAWPTWPPGLWPKVEALAQKVIRRLLRWYINPIVEQQNRFNAAVTEALTEMWRDLSRLQETLWLGKHRNEVRGE